MNRLTFLVAGGDLRQVYLAQTLAEKYEVHIFGIDSKLLCDGGFSPPESLAMLGKQADVLILPVPASNDSVTLNAPFYDREIALSSLLSSVREGGLVFGGKLTLPIVQRISSEKLTAIDYFEREELNVLNAVATAEGAVQLAIEELPTTVFGQNVLITGFGRISKAVAKILVAMGASVTVAARKQSDIAWAEIYGCNGLHISQLREHIPSFPLIINTVPAMIFDDELLENIQSGALVIDLASKPGGVDFDAAARLGVKTIWALSLPGKVAPVSSGKIIARTILNILDERSDADET